MRRDRWEMACCIRRAHDPAPDVVILRSPRVDSAVVVASRAEEISPNLPVGTGSRDRPIVFSAMRPRYLLALGALFLAVQLPAAADWPQFLGPTVTGLRGAPIVTTFPPAGPAVVWRKKIGQGLSGPVVVGNVILFHRVGDRGSSRRSMRRAGRRSGERLSDGLPDDFGFDEGPRAVPVVAAGSCIRSG